MTRIMSVVAALSLAAVLGACTKDEKKAEPTPAPAAPEAAKAETANAETPKPAEATPTANADIGTLSAEELDALIAKGDCTVLDVNGEKVRKEFGKIPSAKLLSSYAEYELTELPADKASKLVFYCSNTECGASKKGAKRALAAGYTDVNVLPVGVIGWKEAGKKTEDVM